MISHVIPATIENTTNASLAITMKLQNIHPPYNVMETFKIIFTGQSHDEMRMNLCTDVCSQTSSTPVQLNQTSQNVFTMVYDENSDYGVDIDVNGVVKRWFTMDNQLVIGKLELAGFQVHRVNFTQHEYVFLITIGHLYFGNDKMGVLESGEVINMPTASQLILKANEMLCQPAMPNFCAQRSENATMVFSINSKDHFHFYNGHLYHKESNSCYNLETFGTCTGIAKISIENYYHYPIGMESGFFGDTQFHASSTIGPGFEGSKCRLNNVLGHWTPAISTTDSYLLLDFEKIININSISIQGSAPLDNFTPSWVRTLDIDIRINLEPWIKVHQNLLANVDANTTAHIILYERLSCSALKLTPVTWRNGIAMRLELYTGLLSVPAVLVEVLNQPRTVKITLPSPSGVVSCSVLKPGDGSAYILGPSFCPSIFSLPNINSSLIYNGNVHINHTYPGYGIYKLYFTSKTTVFHKEQYQMVTVKACPMAKAYVYSNMIRMYVSEDLLLSVGVENVCDEIKNREYQWSVFNETNVQSSGNIVSTWADAYFPTRYFKPGNYRVRVLLGSEEILGVSTEVLLQVHSSPLVMAIYGGERRTIGNELDAVVDGKSQSYDPDIKVKSSQDMTFSWECWVLHPANQSMASKPLCGGHVIPEGDFILPRDVLQADSLLLVTGTGSKDERISNVSQYLHVVNGQPADIFIRCKDNCWEYSRTSLDVKLQMECGNCRSDVVTEYTWQLLEGGNEEKTLSQNTSTGINSEGLVILPEFLQQNKTYVVVGSATIAGQPKGYCTVQSAAECLTFRGNVS
uniref:F5/8 type C domain-containing protein n=1 Tax=Eptatretus burgeri TaxID=7764 RepID=A0A8C4QPT7_EPTBU